MITEGDFKSGGVKFDQIDLFNVSRWKNMAIFNDEISLQSHLNCHVIS
jgi:hypothetical protein